MDPNVTPTDRSSVGRHEREKENPQIIDGKKENISPDAQLQIAALIGYLDIAKQVLIQRPQLARDLNNMLVATIPQEPAPSTAQEQETLLMEQPQVVVDGANDESSNINDPTKLNKACCCMPSKTKAKLVVDGDPEKWISEKKNTLMVVASLIASLTFQAALNPPGGVWQGWEVKEGFESIPGQAINPDSPYLSSRYYFSMFMFFDTLGLAASLSIILLLTEAVPIRRQSLMWVLVVVMWVAVFSVGMAFSFGVVTIMAASPTWILRSFLLLFFIIIFLGNTVRFLVYSVKKGIRAVKKMVHGCVRYVK